MTVYYLYSRTDGSFQGSGIFRYENAEVGSTTVPYPCDADHPCYWDGTQWGETPTAHDPPTEIWPRPLIPPAVTRFQAIAALHQAGLLGQIEQAVAQADPLIQLAWEHALMFHRDSPAVRALAQAVGITEDQLDNLFYEAAKIEV